MPRYDLEKPESPYRDAQRWGNLSELGQIGEEVEGWIEQGGVFYSGLRLAGATHEEAQALIDNRSLDLDAAWEASKQYRTSDPGTLGYLAFGQLVGVEKIDG